MTTGEAVVIGWLQIPPEMVSARWPEHEIPRQLPGKRVGRFPVLFYVSPLRSHAEHELRLLGERPWFFKEKICVPFRRVPSVKGRHPRLQFKPVLNGGTLCRKVWREGSSASAEVPIGGRSYFQDNDCIVRIRGS